MRIDGREKGMKKVITDSRVPIKIWTEDVDYNSIEQLKNIANLPFIFKHVAAMPDVHLGKGATVGSVIATKGAIIPAAVGVDIGCGMSAIKLPFNASLLKENDTRKARLRSAIEAVIPVGSSGYEKVTNRMGQAFKVLGDTKMELETKVFKRATTQIGTLGGGNHFIEICEDTNDGCWLMLHSGSRNVGNRLASKHINKAKGLMKEYFISLPDPDLAYFTQKTKEFEDYVHDLMWAQKYAKFNRVEMVTRVLEVVLKEMGIEKITPLFLMKDMIDCHHNYTAIENHFGENVYVTRKGAVKATQGTLGIIPGSMGAKSFIVEGKGNPMSFCSCSHGAGRRFSRSEAKRRFTQEDLIKQTEGVECRKDSSVIDEIPGAYKDIDEVMENQKDLVDIKYQLKQMICIKG